MALLTQLDARLILFFFFFCYVSLQDNNEMPPFLHYIIMQQTPWKLFCLTLTKPTHPESLPC